MFVFFFLSPHSLPPSPSPHLHISSIQFLGLAATQNMAKHEPMFVTRSETFKFVAGETIHLPCEVSNAGNFNLCLIHFIHPTNFSRMPDKPKYIYCLSAINVFRWFSFDAIRNQTNIDQLRHQFRIQKSNSFDIRFSIGFKHILWHLVVIGTNSNPFESFKCSWHYLINLKFKLRIKYFPHKYTYTYTRLCIHEIRDWILCEWMQS